MRKNSCAVCLGATQDTTAIDEIRTEVNSWQLVNVHSFHGREQHQGVINDRFGQVLLLADGVAEVECVDEFFDETDDHGDHG